MFQMIASDCIAKLKQEINRARKPFLILSVCILVAMTPLLIADFNYYDDLGRVAIGYRSFSDYSRYVSEFGSILLHAGMHLSDISPFPQILAALVIAGAGIAVIGILKKTPSPASLMELIAVLPLALSPYFLGCLSYKYDSPYMAFSVLVSVVPLLLWKLQGGGIVYCLFSALCSIAMCMSYQAASGIYPMLVIFAAFRLWNDGRSREAISLALQSAASYLAGLLLFNWLFMPEMDSYVSTSILPLPELIPGFFAHLAQYARLIISDFKRGWLLLILVIFLAFVIVSVFDSRRSRMAALGGAILTLLLSSLLAFGVYPALTIPLQEPRAMFGFGALIAFAAVSICSAPKAWPARLCILALSWCFFVFSLTYGNALSQQKHYAQSRLQLVVQDLNDLANTQHGKAVSVSGDIGYAPVIERMPRNQRILKRLVPTLFSGNDWGENYLYCYYGLKNIAMLEDASYILDNTDITQFDLPVLKDTMFHTIRGNQDYIVIDLK